MISRRGLIGWVGATAAIAAAHALEFVRTVAAATRPNEKNAKAPIKTKSTPDLQLFGLSLGTRADGSVERPSAFWITGTWNVSLDSAESPTTLTVDVALLLADTFALNAKFALSVENSGDAIRPSVVQPAQSAKACDVVPQVMLSMLAGGH